jgi:hypothetical protein
VKLVKSIIAQFPGKTWHVSAILPEELGKVYEQAGFVREQLSQWQMKLELTSTMSSSRRTPLRDGVSGAKDL